MSKQVLIIEDSGSLRMVVKVTLERAGYEITQAANAEETCTMLHAIVCDLNMPGVEGLQVHAHGDADHRQPIRPPR